MGKIEIDHTGSGGGITLSSDGTSLLLGGTAIGGGGADLYAAETTGSTDPTATGTLSLAIGSSASASSNDGVAIGTQAEANGTDKCVAIGYDAHANSTNGSFAFGTATRATSNMSMALGFQANCGGIGAVAAGYTANAGATFSTAIGFNAKTETGSNSTALTNSYASGADSFAAAIANNTSTYGATGANSVAIGPQAKATGQRSFAATYGVSNNQYSIAFGPCVADQARTFSSGFDAGAYEEGKFARSSGSFNSSSYGQAQYGLLVLRSDTTNATAEALTSNNSAASTTNQIILQNNSAFAFHGTIVARQKAGDGTASAAWKVEGLIRREGSAGTTVLVNSATTVLDNTPSWGMALSADTTNGGLKIEVTGAASTNIRWVATIHTSEVIYA